MKRLSRMNDPAVSNRELRAISSCNRTLMRAEDEQTLLRDMCSIVCDEAGYRMAWVGYAEGDDTGTLRLAAWAGAENGYLEQIRLTAVDAERGHDPAETALRSGKSVNIQDFTTALQAASWRDSALQRGYRSSISLPLKDENENTFAVLSIYSTEPKAFTPDEIRFLEELTDDLAFGIMTLRARIERRHTEEELREQERYAQSLLRLSKRLERAQTYSEALNAARDEVRAIIGYEDLWAYLLTEDNRYAKLLVTEGPLAETLRADKGAVTLTIQGDRMLEEIAAAKDIVIVEDARIDERTNKEIVARLGNRTIVNVPIFLMDKHLGAVGTGTYGDSGVRVPTESEQKYLAALASHMAVTLDRIHLFSERKRAEEALKTSQVFIKNILESVDEGFIVVDRQYRILSANKAFGRLIKSSEALVISRHCYEVSHGTAEPCFERGEECPVKRTFETGVSYSVTHTHPDRAGGKPYVEVKSYPILDASGTVVSVIMTMNDVTEKKKLEDQLRQAQKMEAIGTLAGGVAHDFNNILTVITGYASMAKNRLRPGDPLQAMIDPILSSSERAAHLTQGLLAFSRKQIINPKPVDLNEIVSNIDKLLRRLIGEDIHFSTLLAEKSLITMADAGQIEQVLMNLATNARDAMPEGGALTIKIEEINLGADFVVAHGYGKPGKYALISVSDTGVGMDEKTREKIFDPFFTTKELGRGTGLGLAIVYGIVKQHEGAINVYSEPGKGTTFKIYLPFALSAIEEVHAEAAQPPRGGTETILLAEDDLDIRRMIGFILTEFGYRVVDAVDGEDALEKFTSHGREIDLLILDVIMPKKSGREVHDVVKAARPDANVLFISGYTADMLHKKGIFEKGIEFISKPVSPYDLLRKIRDILDRRGQTT